MSDRHIGLASLGLPSCMSTVAQQKQNNGGKRKETTCSYWNRNMDARYEHLPRVSLDQRKCHAGTCIKHKHPRACGRQRGGGGGLAARSPVGNSILFTLPMQLHQMQPSLKSRYDRHSRGWDFFVSTPCLPFFFLFFFHLTLPPGHVPPPPPQPQTPLVGLPLWIEERGLTKVSMVTVHSVNHAAADVSSPSLFPFFLLPPRLPSSCLYTTPPFLSPPLWCTLARVLLHLINTFR